MEELKERLEVIKKKVNIQVNPEVIRIAKMFGKKEAYAWNNLDLAFYINPSELRKEQYNVNWEYINKL